MNLGTATILRANARRIPLPDNSVDLIVTSPPYFALRSYTDGGEHYDGQIGSEPTPAEFLDALIEVTAECIRVLKPTGSLWVNLGDKYSDRAGPEWAGSSDRLTGRPNKPRRSSSTSMAPRKSLLGLPWRYGIRCIDELGLILRAEVIWSKPNGLPESVTDRVRRVHEQWFHFTREPHYFSAIDEIREAYIKPAGQSTLQHPSFRRRHNRVPLPDDWDGNPLGKLPTSVWTVATEQLVVPEHLEVQHYAAFPSEFPRRIILGWSPIGACSMCGEPRRPLVDVHQETLRDVNTTGRAKQQDISGDRNNGWNKLNYPKTRSIAQITGYACPCGSDTPPVAAVVLDPFGGTGTTALVAKALGRDGISIDMSADYCRLASWRTSDRDQLAKVLGIDKAQQEPAGEPDLFTTLENGASA